jgi:hypothetical protein
MEEGEYVEIIFSTADDKPVPGSNEETTKELKSTG